MFLPVRTCQVFFFLLCSLLALLTVRPGAKAQDGRPPVLNPKTITSPSGEYALSINPSDREGKGKAAYRLSRKGTVVWEGSRPFTLWEAGVTNDGSVGGYAYSQGLEGWGGEKHEGYGDFEVVILDPAGKPRLHQQIKRQSSRFMHVSPTPLAAGLIVDAANDRMIVRVSDEDWNRRAETWWAYQLSTGKVVRRYTPKLLMEPNTPAQYIIGAQPLAGTPLTLLHWWRLSEGTPWSFGARFTLIDLEGKPVWSLDLPRDYTIPGSEKAQDQLMDDIQTNGAILPIDAPGQFTLRFAAQKQRVTFAAVSEEQGKWRVTEVHREPYVPVLPKNASFDAPAVHLTLRDQIQLQAPGSGRQSPIRRCFELTSAGPHRLAFIRRDTKNDLVLAEEDGSIVHTVSLDKIPRKPNDTLGKLLWQSGTRFLVFVERQGPTPEEAYTELYQVDARTGVIGKLPGFRCPPIDAAAMFPDGGFVVLATIHTNYSMKEEVYAYDGRGRRTWALTRDFGHSAKEGPERLFSPKSLTVLSDGRVAVLDVIRHTVQVYTRRGRYDRTIDLDKSWGRKATYPSDIFADPQGGFVVHDFDATPSLVWMNAGGGVLRSFTPRYATGAEMLNPDMSMAADGHIWVSDSYSLLRLDSKGRADKRVGEAAHADQLRAIVELVIRPNGRILAADERTNAVHVFDTQGRWQFVCKPRKLGQEAPSLLRDISKQIELGPHETFAIDGEWFGAVGERQEKPPGFKSFRERVQRLERRPDGTWLKHIAAYTTAPDGALAIIDGGGPLELKANQQRYLSLYTRLDTPQRLIPLPAVLGDWLTSAYDGKQVILASDGQLYCYRATGEPLWRFALPQAKAAEFAWTPFLTDAGHTLCLFDGQRTIYRYALP